MRCRRRVKKWSHAQNYGKDENDGRENEKWDERERCRYPEQDQSSVLRRKNVQRKFGREREKVFKSGIRWPHFIYWTRWEKEEKHILTYWSCFFMLLEHEMCFEVHFSHSLAALPIFFLTFIRCFLSRTVLFSQTMRGNEIWPFKASRKMYPWPDLN